MSLGDDVDTTDAVCGQLAGAYRGELGIPVEWLERSARRDMIERAINRCGLVVQAEVTGGCHLPYLNTRLRCPRFAVYACALKGCPLVAFRPRNARDGQSRPLSGQYAAAPKGPGSSGFASR